MGVEKCRLVFQMKGPKYILSYHPNCVDHQVLNSILIQTKQAKNHKYYVEKIGQNGQPHVAQKIKNLSFERRDELQCQNRSLARSGHMDRFNHFGTD